MGLVECRFKQFYIENSPYYLGIIQNLSKMDVTVFYVSPWMMLGLILGTVYFVLVLLGYENRNENKTRKKSEDVLTSLRRTPRDVTGQKKVQTAEEKPGFVVQRKESDEHELGARKQIDETSCSYQRSSPYQTTTAFEARKSKVAPVDNEKGEELQVENSLEASKIEDILQSQDALHLQEFNVPEGFITQRLRIRASSHGSDHSREDSEETVEKTDCLESSTDKETELCEIVSETVSNSVGSVPVGQIFNDTVVPDVNEQPTESNDAMESTAIKESGIFGDFADLMVAKAKEGAFHKIDLESKANIYADEISSRIVSDAIGQFANSSLSGPEDFDTSEVQELHSFAENVVKSLMDGASDNVSLFKDVVAFAQDVSEQVILEGIEQYTTTEKLEQGRRQKISLSEMKLFSEGIVSEVVSEGIEEAIREGENVKGNNFAGNSVLEPGHADLADQTVTVSSSIQPQICGIVENLVNGAIYEALLRAKAQCSEKSLQDSKLEGCAQEILESQVNDTVQELIVSALHQAADLKELQSQERDEPNRQDKSELESQMETFVDDTLDAAVTEAAGKVQIEQCVSDQEGKVLNGHVDLTLEQDVHQQSDNVHQISVKLADDDEKTNETEDQGVDLVPSRECMNGKELNLKETKTNEQNDYWRRSLIMDLEDNEEFDESFESEKSRPSAEKEAVSDEDESEEFIDSSEDEVIDHAEDAKLGAVGGSSAAKFKDGNSDADDISEDELDDDNDDEEEDLLFAGQTMEDGLCVSKPKEKRKSRKKSKSLPRARIQSGWYLWGGEGKEGNLSSPHPPCSFNIYSNPVNTQEAIQFLKATCRRFI